MVEDIKDMAHDEAGQPPIPRASAAYDGDAVMTPAARDLVADFLARAQGERGLPVTAKTTQIARLVVSELVTNVAKYAPGPCLLDAEILGDGLQLTVWDTEAHLPGLATPDTERVGRHGMEIVLALCRHFEISQQTGGKRIRARITLD
ncbi:ATP-binding protein [Streptomyces barkulensis]|uniref:ATP-binding protein n=1 Tax=Streptomyces barkulensis TaxID=1257026 RepID=UPI001F0F344E|nr:ATP-binding protein [Streptomyces barkulensis]